MSVTELADVGEEEWEYAASTAAAPVVARMLHEDEPARRVVLAVDVPSRRGPRARGPHRGGGRRGRAFRLVGAVLADSADAEGDVAAARDALATGAGDADGLAERCLDHELGWWAAQEIGDLLAETEWPEVTWA